MWQSSKSSLTRHWKAQTDIQFLSVRGKKTGRTQRNETYQNGLATGQNMELVGQQLQIRNCLNSVLICRCYTNQKCSIIEAVSHNPVWPVPFWIFQMSSHHNFTLLDVLYVSRRAHKLQSNDWKHSKRSRPPLTFRNDPLKQAHYRDQTPICDYFIYIWTRESTWLLVNL